MIIALMKHLLFVRHCAKCSRHISTFNPQNNPVCWYKKGNLHKVEAVVESGSDARVNHCPSSLGYTAKGSEHSLCQKLIILTTVPEAQITYKTLKCMYAYNHCPN